MGVGCCNVCGWKWEGVGDFEGAVCVHSYDRSGGSGWEGGGASLDDFHHDLKIY